MKNSKKEKFVTESLFKKSMTGLNRKIDGLELRDDQLDKKIDGVENRLNLRIEKLDERVTRIEENMATKQDIRMVVERVDVVALSLLKTQEDVARMQETNATKQDIRMVIDRIDFFAGTMKGIDQEQRVQALHIKEHGERLTALEHPNI